MPSVNGKERAVDGQCSREAEEQMGDGGKKSEQQEAERAECSGVVRQDQGTKVLLLLTLAVSQASADHCASSVGSKLDVSVHGHKNASGHWMITVDTRRFTSTENQWELAVNVHQERRSCDSSEIEQLVSVTTVHRPVHGTSTNTTPAIDTTSKPTTTTPTKTTTTTTKPKSCPHSGYQLFEGFNCYKGYEEWKSWSDAREQCKSDRGDLMVSESERERSEVFPTMYESAFWGPWMGVYKPEGEDRWVSVKGEPALSSWWRPRYPNNNAGKKCALAVRTGLLMNYNCAERRSFICEIPL
ncbi:hemolymph lipopolysaccharide-binding protein-like [Anabrus simplex]|uniref:hemolymph lipopolysaccharide-binding protein-like n=1 Tax=Anabrus simplex TaxID=316456 RepID=UPI0035A3A6D5